MTVKRIADLPLADRLYSPTRALDDIGSFGEEYGVVRDALIESGYEREVQISERDITNSSARLGTEIIAGINNSDLTLSQSKIDSYVSCPFGYFCRYMVKLSEDERAEFDSLSIGSFIHSILENFFRTLSESGRKTADLSAEEKLNRTLLSHPPKA